MSESSLARESFQIEKEQQTMKVTTRCVMSFVCRSVELFLSDKRVSESTERRANRCQRTGHICHRQEHNTSGTCCSPEVEFNKSINQSIKIDLYNAIIRDV